MSFLAGLSMSAYGQRQGRASGLAVQAMSAWQSGDAEKARLIALRGLQREPDNLQLVLLLAEVHRELNQPEDELLYLEKALQLPDVPPLIDFRLGEAYYKAARYHEALVHMERYLAGKPLASLTGKAERIRDGAAFSRDAVRNPVIFSPVNLGDSVNTLYDEYWPTLTVDGSALVFTRLLPEDGKLQPLQEDFYISRFDGGEWSLAEPVSQLNTPLNEGAQSISADGNLLFFTWCNHPSGMGSCDIWFSRLENGNWSAPRNAGRPVNTNSWEGQPSLSAFGDVLYFSSNRPGGKGNKDIWRVELIGWRPDGLPHWGDPVNLGDSINTPGDEISPFIHPNGNDLFFSSDYWPGLGGLDLFRSRRNLDGSWTKAKNLGYPINTAGNEQGLVIDRTGTTAFMSSGRNAGQGMDIYSFELDDSLRPDPVTYIRGNVKDAHTGNPVPAAIRLSGLESGRSVDVIIKAGPDGIFTLALPAGQEFSFHVDEPGYLFYSEYFMVEQLRENLEPVLRDILLTPVEIGSQTHLHNIFFETGSHEILQQSGTELVALAGFLQQNATVLIEVQGHTDNIGPEAYNQDLSERRARSVVDYLIGKGIASARLEPKGYGLTMPIDTNVTESGRARNRRTTIQITGVLTPVRE